MSVPSITPPPTCAPFIVLEGVDGSGKTTQAQQLADWLRAQGRQVLLTREPGGTALAERLRGIVLDAAIPCAPRAELLLMLAARAQHVAEVIAPALAAGTVVISDRFSLSSLAYQGYGRGLPLEDIRQADAVARAGTVPTLTIVLALPLAVTLSRIGERQDRFEGEGRAFLQRVIDGYQQLAATDDGVCAVNGAETPEQVQAALRALVAPVLAP